MDKYTSRIRRIGVINSGMFDTLSLNVDVEAVHLVGANNVGKTSLIALIQFLFFPSIHEMTFIKSTAESLSFYFRPEGSYILFEVRTITGSIRTVGIYGTGDSDSRVNFVFNGSFDLKDFLDAGQVPVPLQTLQAAFFARDFMRFDKFERYEEALLGLHTRGEYNVPMFDLPKSNFRLLRRLMQGLLRLDRIDAADVQQFLIRIVEKGAVRTSFNLMQDFEQRYRHINRLRAELRELEELKPVMARYRSILERIAAAEENRTRHAERLFHLSVVYLSRLAADKEALAKTFQAQEERLENLDQAARSLMQRIAETRTRRTEVEVCQKRFEALSALCRDASEALIQHERDDLTHARIELQKSLAAAEAGSAADLERQLKRLEREHQGVLRHLKSDTLQQMWVEAGFDEAHRALLRFLVASDLSSLAAAEVLADREAFTAASAQVLDYLDAEGRFTGFGLAVPRSLWFVPEKEQEPLEARRTRLAHEIAAVREKIDIAENMARKKEELAALGAAVQAKEALLSNFSELRQLTARWQGADGLAAQCETLAAELTKLEQAAEAKVEASRGLRREQNRTHTALKAAEEQWQQVGREQATFTAFDSAPPENLGTLSLEALRSEYAQVRAELRDITKDLAKLQGDLGEPKADLEARYDRAAADIPFTRWLELKSNLAQEIGGLEAQLQREYDGVFTVVRAKLSKITQAFAGVEAQVAALNKGVRNVRISNIDQIAVALEKTELLDAIDRSIPGQLDLFAVQTRPAPLEAAHAAVEDYFNQIKKYGNEINLKDMFRLKFSVQFNHQPRPVERYEIHRFESNGTETGVKIVIYLGLIGLLQERKNVVGTRIPFFLDEVGSIDSDNLNQLIAYCSRNNFLPIFASPEIRKDISHNYLFRRNGSRSYLASVVKISPRTPPPVPDAATDLAEPAA